MDHVLSIYIYIYAVREVLKGYHNNCIQSEYFNWKLRKRIRAI